ncbi:hypothetical protein, partial [Pseudomonas aeruginosa]|uniref:hypothetical protein n=1 Tax=Pseudomonas aeruginosa TaxID=287 RepID=UPI0019696E28
MDKRDADAGQAPADICLDRRDRAEVAGRPLVEWCRPHAAEQRVVHLQAGRPHAHHGEDTREYVTGETVYVKLLSRTSSAT